MPPHGRKAHGGCNISGLRNQKSKNSLASGTENNTDTEGEPSLIIPVQHPLQEGDAYGSDPKDDCWLSDKGFTNLANILQIQMENKTYQMIMNGKSTYAVAMDDDYTDKDWVPPEVAKEVRKQKRNQKDRAPTYATGPVAANKAAWTLRETKWRNRTKGQINWATQQPVKAARTEASSSTTQYINLSSDSEEDLDIDANDHSNINVGVPHEADPQVELGAVDLSPGHLSVPSSVPSSAAPSTHVSPISTRPPTPEPAMPIGGDGSTFEEDWEAELDERVHAGPGPVLSWTEIRDLVDKRLKLAKKKYTPLAQVNQLLIIRNFATLSLKGFGRIQASVEIARQWQEGEGVHFARHVRILIHHFEIFQDLPKEKRGGARDSRSLLSEESVRCAARTWLEAQPVGSISPKTFQHALNNTILPALDVVLKKPLCERTARRWPIKLGWRLTILRKGVYMDGHEHPDVVDSRNNVFLPTTAKYEELMTKYEGPALEQVPPKLKEGEKEIIALFHDECCFHANDYKSRAWLKDGQTILQKKGRGRLIHVSDFITEASGRLFICDPIGKILRDARKVIFPGTKQLLEQVDNAITIFEEAHPKCQALFVFDQSSAHASLGPDALKAFEMNKGDGGKQRVQ
ncbi:hypothetical protein C8J57DRAFT_1251284 [Mycena rebaudengoi]|nr:hypothetical protein C8J57DRAFT_1251284 [Mycena rebaudengoi]